MAEVVISKSINDHVSELIINRPEHYNSFNTDLRLKLVDAIKSIEDDVSKRVIVYRVNKNRIPLSANFIAKPWTYMINPVIKPISKKKEMFWERCLSLPGLHAKVPRYNKIYVKYYTPEYKLVEHEAHSTWAALLQHEYDHLNGILYPMQMKDFTYFGYNDSPGDIARDAIKNKGAIDPLFLDLVKKWPK